MEYKRNYSSIHRICKNVYNVYKTPYILYIPYFNIAIALLYYMFIWCCENGQWIEFTFPCEITVFCKGYCFYLFRFLILLYLPLPTLYIDRFYVKADTKTATGWWGGGEASCLFKAKKIEKPSSGQCNSSSEPKDAQGKPRDYFTCRYG
jgi:hypothetical protein